MRSSGKPLEFLGPSLLEVLTFLSVNKLEKAPGVHGLFSGPVFSIDQPFILKDFKKANFFVLHIKERDYLSVYAIYLMVLSRFKFYRQKMLA